MIFIFLQNRFAPWLIWMKCRDLRKIWQKKDWKKRPWCSMCSRFFHCFFDLLFSMTLKKAVRFFTVCLTGIQSQRKYSTWSVEYAKENERYQVARGGLSSDKIFHANMCHEFGRSRNSFESQNATNFNLEHFLLLSLHIQISIFTYQLSQVNYSSQGNLLDPLLQANALSSNTNK